MTAACASRAARPLASGTAALLALLATPLTARTEVAEQVPVGVRAIGMGGAFSSLADDASALFWNPAGLVWVGHQEIMATHANLFDTGINDRLAAFVLPLSLNSAMGLDWYHSGFSDAELGFGENRIDLAYAFRPRSWVSLGATAKYLTQSTDIDGGSLSRGSGSGVDAGLILAPWDGVRFGLLAQDARETRLRQDAGGGSAPLYPRTIRIGGSYAWRNRVTAAFDVDHRWHAGVELAPLEGAALRLGVDDDARDPDPATYSYGVGLKTGILRFDYAFVDHPTLPGTHHISLALNFNFNPSQIRIERVLSRDLYASLYKTYARDTLASVQIRNLQDRPLEAQVGAFIPGLMEAPVRQTVTLRPRAVTTVPIRPVLAWRLLQQSSDHPAQLQVTASYQSRRFLKTEKGGARFVAYGPGAIDWSAGVAQAAASVTPRDPLVEGLAREAVRAVVPADITRFGCRNLAFTAALFDALGQLRITYVSDPNNPFSSISETPHAVDTVQYPGETLRKRTGDCDDTSVLMAALLASVGINTRFVDAPGHLFILVDTGLHERNRVALSLDSTRTVISAEEVWVPLETTAITRGFAAAWQLGAESFVNWSQRGEVHQADIAESQEVYEPADFVSATPMPALAAAELATRISGDAQIVAQWVEDYRAERFKDTPDLLAASPEALNQVAQVLYQAGQLEEAQARLEAAVRVAPGSLRLHNNLAVVLAARALGDSALGHIDLALQIDNSDASLWLNRGVLLYEAGDSVSAVEAFSAAISRVGDRDAAARLLGISEATPDDRGEDYATGLTVIRQMLQAAQARVAAETGRHVAAPRLGRPLRTRAGTVGTPDLSRFLHWTD